MNRRHAIGTLVGVVLAVLGFKPPPALRKTSTVTWSEGVERDLTPYMTDVKEWYVLDSRYTPPGKMFLVEYRP